MENSNKIAHIIVYSIFFILPVAGATLWILRILLKYLDIRNNIQDRETTNKTKIAYIIFGFVLFILGLFLCLFIIVTMFFPAYEVPKIIKIFGGILSLLFFAFMVVLYGLGRAVAAGAGSTTGILNKFFNIVSEQTNKLDNKL